MCIDFYSNCAWVIPLKYKKGETITKTFNIIVKNSNRKPNKVWVDKCCEFFKSNIEIHSTRNEEKSVFAQKFIKSLKNKYFRHTEFSTHKKIVDIDRIFKIVKEYNSTFTYSIKIRTVDVQPKTYIGCLVEFNKKKLF